MTITICFLFFTIYYTISSTLQHNNSTFQSNGYQNAVNNYENISQTLLYNHETYYGNNNEKNEFDEYVVTYHEDVYYCINQDIAKCIFTALVISADHDHRIPSIQEIDAITEEKGSFDSLKDVPYYNYEKSVSNLNAYHDDIYDLCYGYDNHYIILKDSIVFDLQLKDNTNLKKLITYYINK